MNSRVPCENAQRYLHAGFHKSISGPTTLTNILGPDVNLYLDQILTNKNWPVLVSFVFAQKHYFKVVSAKYAPNILGYIICEHNSLNEKLIWGFDVAILVGGGGGFHCSGFSASSLA